MRDAAEPRGTHLSATERHTRSLKGEATAPTVSVRRIRPDDAGVLRSLRLRALADSPAAFGERLADAEARPDAEWAATARAASAGDRRIWFIAERQSASGTEPVALVQARRRLPATCLLFAMWVDPTVRGRGVGTALVDAVEAWARSWGGREVILWVFPTNVDAVRLYERIGFERLADGPDADSGRKWHALAMRRHVAPS